MAFVSGAMGRVRSNLVELEAALLAYPRCMAPSDTLPVGSRPVVAGALPQAPISRRREADPPSAWRRCAARLIGIDVFRLDIDVALCEPVPPRVP